MLDGFNGSEKNRLIREADEALSANDLASSVDAIERLYQLFDDTLVSPRRGGRPALRPART